MGNKESKEKNDKNKDVKKKKSDPKISDDLTLRMFGSDVKRNEGSKSIIQSSSSFKQTYSKTTYTQKSVATTSGSTSSSLGRWPPEKNMQTDARPIVMPVVPYSKPKFSTISAASNPFPRNTQLRSTNWANKKVVKTGKRYDQHSPVPTYNTSGTYRGAALLINNVTFLTGDVRKGAELDEVALKGVLKQIGFEVTKKRDLTEDEMRKKIKSFAGEKSLKKYDIIMCVVMSHGTSGKKGRKGVPSTYTEILGVDNEGLDVDEIYRIFSEQDHLINKPKILIYQCCRNNPDEVIQHDAPSNANKYTDFLIAFSTLPGFVANRSPSAGTWYIQKICEVFSEYAHEHDIETLLKMVDSKLENLCGKYFQRTTYQSLGFKRCYLHPK